jgi:hypothetical protein
MTIRNPICSSEWGRKRNPPRHGCCVVMMDDLFLVLAPLATHPPNRDPVFWLGRNNPKLRLARGRLDIHIWYLERKNTLFSIVTPGIRTLISAGLFPTDTYPTNRSLPKRNIAACSRALPSSRQQAPIQPLQRRIIEASETSQCPSPLLQLDRSITTY